MSLGYELSYPKEHSINLPGHLALKEYSISQECSYDHTKPWSYGLSIFNL